MRVYALGLEARLAGEAAQDHECSGAGQRAAVRVQEDLRPVALVEVRPAAGEVAAERLDGLAADRDDPFLRPLAEGADDAAVEIDCSALEADGLRDAQARPVQQLDERAVAEIARRGAGRGLDEPLGLGGRERARQASRPAGGLERGGRVLLHAADQLQVAEERACRCRAPRQRRGRQTGLAAVGDEALELLGRRLCGRAAEPFGEGGQVAAVCLDRARRAARREQGEERVDVGIARGHAVEFGNGAGSPATPYDRRMPEEREGWVEVDGFRTWYRVVGDPSGPRAPLLCLHGGPGSTSTYHERLESLAGERAVVRYDQLGCGHSERPDDPRWTLALYRAEVDAVRAELGLGRVHLLGTSWGGMLALEHALARPGTLAGLILSSTLASAEQWTGEVRKLRDAMPPETVAVFD